MATCMHESPYKPAERYVTCYLCEKEKSTTIKQNSRIRTQCEETLNMNSAKRLILNSTSMTQIYFITMFLQCRI